LIFSFNFPIQLPEFYTAESGLQEALKLVIQGLKGGPETMSSKADATKPKSKAKIKHNMNRNQFKNKDANDEKEYCDTDTLKMFDKDGKASKNAAAGDLNFTPYEKAKEVDLMDFISKSDFTTVGGINNAPKEEKKIEELPDEFNFADFDNAPVVQQQEPMAFDFMSEAPPVKEVKATPAP